MVRLWRMGLGLGEIWGLALFRLLESIFSFVVFGVKSEGR